MTASVRSLRCPSCGAPADPTLPRCPYCDSRLATVACPACSALVSLDARHCPQCGTEVHLEAQAPSPHHCPLGHGLLEIRPLGEVHAHACGTCAGIWMTSDEFQQLSETRELRHAALHTLPEASAAAAPNLQAPVTYRHCAACGKIMNRQNYARISGVIVDVCRDHGYWFDRDELRRVLQFIDGGGLGRARDREILRAQEAERQARQAQWLADTGQASDRDW